MAIRNKKESTIGAGVGALLILALYAAMTVGWIWNLVKLFSAEATGEIVGRAISLFIPVIGSVVGYF